MRVISGRWLQIIKLQMPRHREPVEWPVVLEHYQRMATGKLTGVVMLSVHDLGIHANPHFPTSNSCILRDFAEE